MLIIVLLFRQDTQSDGPIDFVDVVVIIIVMLIVIVLVDSYVGMMVCGATIVLRL